MNVKLAYRLAWSVARHFCIPGYEIEDLVQECVLAAITSPYTTSDPDSLRLLKRTMYNQIKMVTRRRRPEPNTPYNEVEFIYVQPDPGDWIPIPISDDLTLIVVIALLENDMSLEATSEQLHWTRERVNYYWRKAKRSLKTPDPNLVSRDTTLYLAQKLCY